MQSFVKVHGEEELEVTSVMEDVPRLRVKPPAAYVHIALGIYTGPGACDAVGKLSPDDEVLCGMGPRQGRWIKITHPVEGWVQAETRDGQAILHEVVTLRSIGPRCDARGIPPVQEPALREKEKAFFNARASEASRLLREFARLESRGCKGGKPRQTLKPSDAMTKGSPLARLPLITVGQSGPSSVGDDREARLGRSAALWQSHHGMHDDSFDLLGLDFAPAATAAAKASTVEHPKEVDQIHYPSAYDLPNGTEPSSSAPAGNHRSPSFRANGEEVPPAELGLKRYLVRCEGRWRVRSAPSLNSKVIGTIANGTIVIGEEGKLVTMPRELSELMQQDSSLTPEALNKALESLTTLWVKVTRFEARQ
eukprot:s4953_g1.t1